MPRDEAVSDTSPLMNLALTSRLHLLEEQFSRLFVPDQVMNELRQGEEGVGPVKTQVEDGFIDTVQVEEDDLFRELRRELDSGEAATIRYAVREGIETVLIDEKEGRDAARRHDLNPVGVIGILMRAYESSDRFQEAMDELRGEGFWISDDLYRDVLDRHRRL
ncbi:MAG: DUF3368 domain-containing protein [Candidatus Nanohaloarchaea archaeon]|nr:DUF3368 domain-containing protein [Candidatus Nanohaloarchaea archaeon]